jgi:putative transcriptional regulator
VPSLASRVVLLLLAAFALAPAARAQADLPNSVLLVARPQMVDPTFRQTVILVTQAADASTVGVILNRPTERKHEPGGVPIGFGGPVMREVLVALYRAARAPEDSAFQVLLDVWLTMHPRNIARLAEERPQQQRLFAGFAGWSPGQLQSELQRNDWYVLPASLDLVFRNDTSGLWEELVRKARGGVAML